MEPKLWDHIKQNKKKHKSKHKKKIFVFAQIGKLVNQDI